MSTSSADGNPVRTLTTSFVTSAASGGGKGGICHAPSGTVQGAAFGGEKYGILKFGRNYTPT